MCDLFIHTYKKGCDSLGKVRVQTLDNIYQDSGAKEIFLNINLY